MTSRRVLITGGAGGIGYAIAVAFATGGDQVVIADRDATALDRVAAAIGPELTPASGGSVEPLVLDITDAGAVAAAFDALDDVDVLVNNAGILSVHGAVTELSPSDYASILEVNVIGTFIMIQEFARHRIARAESNGSGGAVVNISSIGGRQPTPGMGAYESSKAAVDSLTRWAAVELADHGIRVNAVAPGPVLTPMLEAGMPEGSQARAAWTSRIPLGNLASVDDVAASALFLAGDHARHITGVSLPVDGGQLLT